VSSTLRFSKLSFKVTHLSGKLWGRFVQATAELVEAGAGFVYVRKPGLNLDEWAMCDPDQSYICSHMPAGGGVSTSFRSYDFSLFRDIQRMSVASSWSTIGYPKDATYLSYQMTAAPKEITASDPHRCSERANSHRSIEKCHYSKYCSDNGLYRSQYLTLGEWIVIIT
jgi:hypothetical protein